MSAHDYQQRIKKIQLKLAEIDLAGLIISKRQNIFYLTGLYQLHPTHREAILFITLQAAHLHHSSFLTPPSHPWLTYSTMPKSSLEQVASKIISPKTSIGIESQDLTVSEFHRFENILNTCQFLPYDQILKELRYNKYDSELKLINKANQITKDTMDWIIKKLNSSFHPYTEIQLQHKINQHLFELGAEDTAFPSLVAFDNHSASPHHIATHSKLTKNSVILLDFGAKYQGYCSDMTRTIKLGANNNKFNQIESVVLQAYAQAIRLIQPILDNKTGNIRAADIDKSTRKIISDAGFGSNFIHTTGHGLGLDIHESPSLSSKNDQLVEKNMTITIEPGIYLPGEFGYRHENTILI